jgi:hypothetical protein
MKPQHEDRGTWSVPEYAMVDSIVVEHRRLPIDEAVVKDIMATMGAGDMSALPPIHLWHKEPVPPSKAPHRQFLLQVW